jgi:probable HAF family extracellular repeat protein
MSIRKIARQFFAAASFVFISANVTAAFADNPTCTSGATPCFELLGGLPGAVPRNNTDALSTPSAISADGKVVVGTAVNSNSQDVPFRWVNGTMTDLGKIPDASHGICASGFLCGQATGTNADGSVVTGSGGVDTGGFDPAPRAWLWSGGTMTLLDRTAVCNPLGANDWTQARAVSATNGVVVGTFSCGGAVEFHAFRAIGGSMADLGRLGMMQTDAQIVSADGSVIAGTAHTTCCTEAFRSTGGVPVSLGFLPGDTVSSATAISGNGNVIFGYSAGAGSGGKRAVRWVNSVIDAIGASNSEGELTGANADGTVGVSRSHRWSATNGYRTWVDIFLGWGLTSDPNLAFHASPVAISADGITIAGITSSGTLREQGFIARIPLEPNAPAAIAATGIGGHFFTAKWGAVAMATGYRLDVATDIGFTNILSSYSNLDVGNVLSINVAGLNPNTAYYYRVHAYNPTGPGANSTTISATTLVTHATTLALSGSPSSAKPGQSVQLKATVTVNPPASGTPTGTVTFKEGTKTLGIGAVSGAGEAVFSTAALAIGSHTITAAYGGDDIFLASSGATTVAVSASLRSEAIVNNEFTTGAQQFPAVAALTSGYVVVWASKAQDGNGDGVYGQRYSATGARSGAALHVSAETSGNQSMPKVAGLAAGGFVAVWQSDKQDKKTSGIYARMFTGTKATAAAEFKVNTTSSGAQTQPAIAATSNGGFVIVWTSADQDGDGLGVYGQRYDEAGQALGREFKVNTTVLGHQSAPAVAATTDGFVVVWQGPNADGLGVFGQRYNSLGKPAGKEFAVNKATANDQAMPSVAGLGDGTFVVAWQSAAQDGSGLGVYAQRFTAKGLKSGRAVKVNTFKSGDQWQPEVSGFSDDGFVVLWTSNGQDGSGKGVYAQAFANKTTVRNNSEFRINTTTANDQWQPALAAAAGGKFMAVWTSLGQDGSLEGVFNGLFAVP